jgi:hypothetical protein
MMEPSGSINMARMPFCHAYRQSQRHDGLSSAVYDQE